MSFFVKSTAASKPKTKNVQLISLGLAAVFVLMAVAQLFTFESFPEVIAATGIPGEASVWAAVLVTLEVLALPFLLSMRLSPAMRVVSMVSGWIAIALLLKIAVWANLSSEAVSNSALLGDTVSLPVGWWNVLICLSLGVLAAWSAWGMWPLRPKHSK